MRDGRTTPSSEAEIWLDEADNGRLVVQRCQRCSTYQHYPRPLCITCGSSDLEMVEASGKGTVYSFTEVHRSPDRDRFSTPYTIALVRLEEGPLLLTRLVDTPDPACDMAVRVEWRRIDDRQLPVFRPIR